MPIGEGSRAEVTNFNVMRNFEGGHGWNPIYRQCPARESKWRCFGRMTYFAAGSSRRRYAEAKDGSSYWSVNSRAFAYPMTGDS